MQHKYNNDKQSTLNHYRRDLMTYAFARVGNKALAEDLVQEAYVRFLTHNQNTIIENSKGYLLRTVYNLSIDHFRAQKVHLMTPASDDEIEKAHGYEYSPEHCLSERQMRERFESAYKALPEKQKKIFYLRRMEGESTEQIAKKFNLSRRMVQKYMAQIVLHINSYLQSDG